MRPVLTRRRLFTVLALTTMLGIGQAGIAWERACQNDCTVDFGGVVHPNQFPKPIYDGQTMRFKLWGHFIDVGPGVGISGGSPAGTSVRLVRSEGGAPMGRIFFDLTVPNVSSSASITVRHKTNGSFDSRTVRFTIISRAQGELALSEASVALGTSAANCLAQNGGSAQVLENGARLRISLPAGHTTAMPSCLGSSFQLRFTGRSGTGKAQRFAPVLTGGDANLRTVPITTPDRLKGFANLTNRSNETAFVTDTLSSASVGRLVAQRNLVYNLASGGVTRQMTVEIVPNTAIGVQSLQVIPATGLENDPLTFEAQLSSPAPAGGLRVSWRLTKAACFSGETPLPYSQVAGAINSFTVPAGQQITRITVRPLLNATVDGVRCGTEPTPTSHTLELWTVAPTILSGPGYLRRDFGVLARRQ